MDYKVSIEYQEVVSQLEKKFGGGMELDAILMIIGVQELGQGPRKFSKDEKVNLMHIAICTILEPYGFYEYSHNDDDGWPHFNRVDTLPALDQKEQEFLLKEAVIKYFKVNNYL